MGEVGADRRGMQGYERRVGEDQGALGGSRGSTEKGDGRRGQIDERVEGGIGGEGGGVGRRPGESYQERSGIRRFAQGQGGFGERRGNSGRESQGTGREGDKT